MNNYSVINRSNYIEDNISFKDWYSQYNNELSYIYSKIINIYKSDNILMKNLTYNKYVEHMYKYSSKIKLKY